MRKKLIGVLMLSAILLMGCRRVEPEMRAYPLALGFGYEDNGYQVLYAMPNLSPYTGDGKEPEKRELLWDYTGDSYEKIDDRVRETREQKIDLGHVQVILFEDNLLGNVDKYEETINYLLKQTTLGSNAYVFSTDGLEKLMAENGQMVDSLGEYLVDVLKKDEKETTTLQELYNAYYNQESMPDLLKVRLQDNQILIEGLISN